MRASDKSVISAVSRLKREEYKRTKHDSAFFEWKILIGPSDWEDHLLNKDGAEKYRTHNLPNGASCPGIYELGIAVSRPQSGREFGKLNSNFVIPVYLGQADNVRSRLQSYGREGSHLENGSPNSELNDSRGQGLFREIFSRGFPIVYRWAPMKSKKDAEETEARLLSIFDYAWNKDSNGVRRPNDIHKKLDSRTRTSSTARSHPILRKIQNFRQRKVGLNIKTCENESSMDTNQEKTNIFHRIFKFGRSRLTLVSVRIGVNLDSNNICGVALGQGRVCIRPPIEGRKRCNEHKGMKINGFTPKLKGNAQMGDPRSFPGFVGDLDKDPFSEDLSSVCGVSLHDGSFCAKKPVQGRKRCEGHKGRKKNHRTVSMPVKEDRKRNVHDQILESGSHCDNNELLFSDTHSLLSSEDSTICDGPVVMTNLPFVNDDSSICGARTCNGSFCRRKPGKGSKWCWQHQGKKVDMRSKVSACDESTYSATSS